MRSRSFPAGPQAGGGSVHARHSAPETGEWGVRIYSGDQQKGRTKGEGEAGRAEAELIAAEINRQVEAEEPRNEGFLGLVLRAALIPTGEACRSWLASYGPKLAKGTSQIWQGNIERHIVPALGGCRSAHAH